MSRRSGIVSANQFDWGKLPEVVPCAQKRHDSTALEASGERESVHFDDVTSNDAVEESGPSRRKSVFGFEFGDQSLRGKRSAPEFFNQREEAHDESPTKQLKRKKRLSNLRISAGADATEASRGQLAAPVEDGAVRTLRKSFSDVALRLGVGKRKHEVEAEGRFQVNESPTRPAKRLRLPEINSHVSCWPQRVEQALDGVMGGEMEGIEVCSADMGPPARPHHSLQLSAVRPRQQYPEQDIPRPIPARSSPRPSLYTEGARPLDESIPPPIPARSPYRPYPYTKGARPLDEKRVHANTLAMLEGRRIATTEPLKPRQLENMRKFAGNQIHPAFRQQHLELDASIHAIRPSAVVPRSHTSAETTGDSGYGSPSPGGDESTSENSFRSTVAMLDGAIEEQCAMLGVDHTPGTSRAKRRRLQEALRSFASWDDLARAIAEQ